MIGSSKSSATNRLITAKDHASVQINIGHLDENGVYTGQFTTFALSGFIRAQLRSLKKHLKRLKAPKHWMLDKLGGAFVRTDKTYPSGFTDVVLILKTNENFWLLDDTKDEEAKFK
ncbi:hypothetical protein COCNU_04G010070 [Cocos nucifera]|uniref:Small ribosomal subunit protein eS4 N-terminal domain-containing protein n=1 Tax=Cocos nucifera TaxID=13894 RepID=A0A8K0I6E7_COCNU|nr:hypothetical protein COCNU_04G010070 [Cocos nucifera]